MRFGAGHLDLPALQRACDRLVSRHSALRTVQSPDEAMREAMDRAAAMWQLRLRPKTVQRVWRAAWAVG